MKKVCLVILAIFTIVSGAIHSSFALDQNVQDDYYDESGNYFNPNTGEYFYWTNTSSRLVTVKSFTFKIRGTLSPNYNLFFNEDSVMVWISDAHFEYASGSRANCCNRHEFSVNIRRYGVTNNVARFFAPINTTKNVDLGDGFQLSPTPYKIEITNVDELPYGIYLVGEGTIDTY